MKPTYWTVVVIDPDGTEYEYDRDFEHEAQSLYSSLVKTAKSGKTIRLERNGRVMGTAVASIDAETVVPERVEYVLAADDSPRHVVTLPASFWIDHVDRCDEHGCRDVTPIKRTKMRYTVELSENQLTDLRKDADFYANGGDFLDPEVYKQIGGWAKTMLKALDRQGF